MAKNTTATGCCLRCFCTPCVCSDFPKPIPEHSRSEQIEFAARRVLSAVDQHCGPYPQYPELHDAIEALRRYMDR